MKITKSKRDVTIRATVSPGVRKAIRAIAETTGSTSSGVAGLMLSTAFNSCGLAIGLSLDVVRAELAAERRAAAKEARGRLAPKPKKRASRRPRGGTRPPITPP